MIENISKIIIIHEIRLPTNIICHLLNVPVTSGRR